MTADRPQPIPADPALDELALRRLLDLAGPEAPELMRRLLFDLRDVSTGLAAGFAGDDRLALRKHSHVLLAIAGTIGAEHIHQMALTLNQSCKSDTFDFAAPDAADLLQRLDTLQTRLHQMAADPGLER